MKLLALALLVLGCRGGGAARPAGGEREGRDVVIYAARDGTTVAGGHVDERRWVEVPASGELVLGPVAPQLALDSVVVELLDDPRPVQARGCHVDGAAGALRDAAWLWGRPATIALAGGDVVEGEIVEVGEPVAIIDDGDVRTAVPPATVHHDVERDDDVAPARPPAPGDAVFATLDDGDEVFGTFAALQPSRLVVRTRDGARRALDVDAITRLAAGGLPAQPMLRCALDGVRPGRHLVRFAYAAPDLTWRARYRVTLDDPLAGSAPGVGPDAALDHVALERAFELSAPGMPAGTTARVRLVLGVPAEPEPPVTVWEGDATLGGAAVEVRAEPVRRRARVERVYRGAVVRAGENPRFPEWREESTPAVWRELSFERVAADAPGRLRVGLRSAGATRWLDGELAPSAADVVRVPLAPDPELVGFRRKRGRDPDGTLVLDELTFSVANRGAAPATVAIEEELRPLGRPDILFSRLADRDHRGELRADRWRTTVTVPPGELVQGQLVLRYAQRPR